MKSIFRKERKGKNQKMVAKGVGGVTTGKKGKRIG